MSSYIIVLSWRRLLAASLGAVNNTVAELVDVFQDGAVVHTFLQGGRTTDTLPRRRPGGLPPSRSCRCCHCVQVCTVTFNTILNEELILPFLSFFLPCFLRLCSLTKGSFPFAKKLSDWSVSDEVGSKISKMWFGPLELNILLEIFEVLIFLVVLPKIKLYQ